MYESVKEQLKNMEDTTISCIQDCVRIDSVKGEPCEGAPYGPGPKKALEYALGLAEKFGFKCKNVGNRAGWAEYGDGEEMVAVLGHLDVVPVGEGWKYPPFGAEIHDGVMYGRGVIDDKGPIIGALCGLYAIKQAGIKLDRRIRVIFGTDEECGSSCMKHYIESGEELPVAGFTPDGEYPLIFFEKGMTGVTAGKKNPVPGEVEVLSLQGGSASNVVTEKCRMVIKGKQRIAPQHNVTVAYDEDGNTVVESIGVGAHGSTPAQGVNAAVQLFRAVKRVKFGGDFQQFMNFVLQQVGDDTQGKTMGLWYQDDETGETTVNLGVVKYTPEEMSLTLDIRYPKNADVACIREHLNWILPTYGMEVLKLRETPFLYVPQDSEVVTKLMQVYKDETGRDDKPLAIGGGTYAKMFRNMVAFGPEIPGVPALIHQPNEAFSVENLLLSNRITVLGALALATK